MRAVAAGVPAAPAVSIYSCTPTCTPPCPLPRLLKPGLLVPEAVGPAVLCSCWGGAESQGNNKYKHKIIIKSPTNPPPLRALIGRDSGPQTVLWLQASAYLLLATHRPAQPNGLNHLCLNLLWAGTAPMVSTQLLMPQKNVQFHFSFGKTQTVGTLNYTPTEE